MTWNMRLLIATKKKTFQGAIHASRIENMNRYESPGLLFKHEASHPHRHNAEQFRAHRTVMIRDWCREGLTCFFSSFLCLTRLAACYGSLQHSQACDIAACSPRWTHVHYFMQILRAEIDFTISLINHARVHFLLRGAHSPGVIFTCIRVMWFVSSVHGSIVIGISPQRGQNGDEKARQNDH